MSTASSSRDESADLTDPSRNKILTLTFNPDCTALAMGTSKTYCFFTIDEKNKIDETHDCGIKRLMSAKHLPFEAVRIVERLFSTSLTVLVSDEDPRKLNVFHYRKGTEIQSDKFPTTILAVKLNRSRIIICLEENIWIYDIRNMKALRSIVNIPSNLEGLCALSPSTDSPYLAYPGSSTIGQIYIFDTNNLNHSITIHAHNEPLVAMSFDMSGTQIASASSKGMLIRVHNVVDGSCLFEFRRGTRRFATIYSLAFSPSSMFLAASSNTGTVHIFRLMNSAVSESEKPSTWMGSVNRLAVNAAYYLPSQTPGVLTQYRSFAAVHLPSAEMKTTVAMNSLNGKLILFVARYDGVVSAYEVNTTEGGECQCLSEYPLYSVFASSNNEQTTGTNVGQAKTDEPTGEYPPNLLRNNSETLPYLSAEMNVDAS